MPLFLNIHLQVEIIDDFKMRITTVQLINTNEQLYLNNIYIGTALICALKNGAMWILRADTLESLDPLPYKHSNHAILEVAFSECSNFMAYFDDFNTVAVFKRNENFPSSSSCYYDFIGKYRSHNLPIVNLLFSPISHQANKAIPRFLSLGKDRELVEYDLRKRSSPLEYTN